MDLKKIEAGSLDLLGEGYILVDHAATQLGATHGEIITHLLARSAGFYVYRDDWDGWLVDDMDQLYHEHDETGLVGVDLSDSELAKHGRRSKLSPRHLQLRFAEEVLAISQAARQPVDVSCFLLPSSRTSGFVVEIPGRAISVDQLMVNKADVEQLRSWLASRITPEMLAEAAPPRAPAPADTPHHGLAHAKHTHLPLADVLSIYIDRNRGKWKPNTLHTNSDRCAILLELMGNLPLKDIDRDSLWRVVEKLRKLPDGRQHVRRRFKRPEATFTELIDLAEQHHLPRLSTQAVEKLVDGFGEIFTWAVTQTYLTANPALKLGSEVFSSLGGKRSKASQDRDQLSPDDLRLIFSVEWFAKGVGTKTKEGLFYAYRPYYYWLPLLGLLAGGRLNELAQLYLADICCSPSGVNYLDFNLDGEDKVNADKDGADAQGASGQDKSLKTINAVRQVPIHPRLIELGFIDYVQALRKAGHARLFPELQHDKTKGYGKHAGSWFNERFLGKQLGVKRDGRKTFHSFRHNFSTTLGDADIPSIVKSQLMGHSFGKAENESRYDKGRRIDQLAEHLGALNFGLPDGVNKFSITDGLQAVSDALKLKRSRRSGVKRPT